MQNSSGCLITLEGSDGAGKATQLNLLAERLKAAGYDVAIFDFPRYDHESSYFVQQYLNGKYGPASAVSPYTASLFFALDRYEAAPEIEKALAEGKVALSNRYAGSNMAHQGGKFNDPLEKRSYFVWADSLEFQLLKIPRPKLNIFLRVPAEVSYELISKKAERNYTKATHDEHEKDLNHLTQSVATYDLLCQLFPNDFRAIDCTEGEALLSIPEISDRIWEMVKPLLPGKPMHEAHSTTVSLKPPTDKAQDQKDSAQLEGSLELSKNVSLRLAIDMAGLARDDSSYSLDWRQTDYKYLIPEDLPKKTTQRYSEILDRLSANFKKATKVLAEEGQTSSELAAATPLAALVPADISVRPTALRPLLGQIKTLNYKEAQQFADELSSAAQKVWPEFSTDESTDRTTAPEPIADVLSKFAQEHLPANFSPDSEGVKLVNAEPHSEFKAIAASIYQYSQLPLEKVEAEVEEWPYQQKYDALTKAVRALGSPTLDKLRYQFDAIVDQALLARLRKTFGPDKIRSQPATVRYGFDTPASLESGVPGDLYETCFDDSFELFSILQPVERTNLGAYGTLLGHKLRLGLELSASDIAMIASRQQPALKSLAATLIDAISQVHPTVAEALKPKPAKKLAPAPRRGRQRRR